MKLSKLFMTALLVGTLAVIGCGSDDGDDSGGGNTNGGGGEACNVGACATNDAFKAACLDIYEDCLDLGNPEAQCRTTAEAANCNVGG